MNNYKEIITLMEAPLLFLAGNSFRNIELVKDFEGTMRGFFSKMSDAEGALDAKPHCRERARVIRERMERAFEGFDRADSETKKACVVSTIRCFKELKHLMNDGGRSVRSTGNDVIVNSKECFDALAQPIQFVKGVGPKIAALLVKKGIHTIEDMIYFLPRHYEDRRHITRIGDAAVGSVETILGTVVNAEVKRYRYKSVFEVIFDDGSGAVTAKWFRGSFSYLQRTFKTGERFFLIGEVRGSLFERNIFHPDYEKLDSEDEDSLHVKRIVPIYSETEGLNQKYLRRIMMRVVNDYARYIISPIPDDICRRLRLPHMEDAVKRVHFPESDADMETLNRMKTPSHRRLVFDEFFFFELGMALKKRGNVVEKGNSFVTDGSLIGKFYDALSFELTHAQKRVIDEILEDMKREYPMNRLLQGDVGSGKTVVSMVPMIVASENRFQSAIMAPTEMLAEQHYRNIGGWAKMLGLSAVLLTGSMKTRERNAAVEQIQKGEADIIIGTHTLIQEGVIFKRLGFVVIDEQHRFGVRQRAVMRDKGVVPDVLVMTATPIPRTLAMTVYGDLDVSVIDQMPPAKKPIKTKLYFEKRRDLVYACIDREIRKGNQVFIVYPLVEESEALDLKDATTMAAHLQKDIFPDFRVGLVHGRMKGDEKDRIMGDFRNGAIDMLVSTTVIEVGIDIPRASLMVIEHAERFGLSQLHQLRGRVGRGASESSCILVAHHLGSEDARRRLRIMEQTADGFRIAEEDLAIRGPGEFMGVRQSGLPDFRVANILRDGELLDRARKEAFLLSSKDPHLEDSEHILLREVLLRRWKDRLELAKTG